MLFVKFIIELFNYLDVYFLQFLKLLLLHSKSTVSIVINTQVQTNAHYILNSKRNAYFAYLVYRNTFVLNTDLMISKVPMMYGTCVQSNASTVS